MDLPTAWGTKYDINPAHIVTQTPPAITSLFASIGALRLVGSCHDADSAREPFANSTATF